MPDFRQKMIAELEEEIRIREGLGENVSGRKLFIQSIKRKYNTDPIWEALGGDSKKYPPNNQ